MSKSEKEDWSGGEAYDYFMGRWSRKTADLFLDWLDANSNLTWLDIGCGTGALSQNILDKHTAYSIWTIDPSWNFVHHARKNLQSSLVHSAVSFADTIPLINNYCDTVVSGLMLNFTPDPISAAKEMARVTKSGGTVAAYVWDYAGRMEWLRYFWDAALTIDPSASEFDEGQRFPLCEQDNLEIVFNLAGLKQVEVTALDTITIFENFDAYWKPFLSGEFPAPHYLKSLSSTQQNALQETVKSALPIAEDDSIKLIARAWGVRGIV